jgi:hypothetical protein
MDPKAIAQAKARLKKAERALQALKDASKYEEAEDAWTEYLLATTSIYSKLEQGAKGNGKSMAWFGRKKNERRNDPLLSYLHFARNADEHGIERVTSKHSGFHSRTLRPKFNERHRIVVQRVDEKTMKPTGPKIKGMVAGPCIRCVKVRDDRFGDERDPPKEHLGAPIMLPELPNVSGSEYPDILAETALTYFRALIAEAEDFVSTHRSS